MTAPPRTRESLVAVVVSAGNGFQDKEGLNLVAGRSEGPGSAGADAGQLAVYSYLGDLALRFMFVAEGCVDSPARLEDMQRLDLTPERALALATVSFKRTQEVPLPCLVNEGVYTLRGGKPEAYSGYFLDRSFWRSQLARSPSGVLVALPKRGTLLFSYAEDGSAIQALRTAAVAWYQSAGEHALSASIYRFDAKGWHVQERQFTAQRGAETAKPLVSTQGNTGEPNRTVQGTGKRPTEREEADQELAAELRLSQAAKGQKAVIYSIVLNMVLGGVGRSNTLPILVLMALSVAVAIYALVGVVRMCSGLEKTQGKKIAFMVVTFVPLLNLIALLRLSGQTSRRLRDAGWSVGLLGVRS